MRYLTNKEYGLFLTLGGLTYIACGFNMHYVLAQESWWGRSVLFIPSLLAALYIYRSDMEESKTEKIVYFFIFAASAQYLYYSYFAKLDYYYSGGLFSLIAASAIGINSPRALMVYILGVNILVTGMVPFLEGSLFSKMLINFYAFSAIIYIFQRQKIYLLGRAGRALTRLKESKKKIESIYSMNLQAAHDLGSPVSAIAAVADKIKYENPKAYRMLEASVERLNEISGDLLTTHKKNHEMVEANFFDLENNISQLVADKRKEYSDEKGLFIFYRVTAPLLGEVNLPKSEFYRVFSNLINNSVDSMHECHEKRIKVEITPKEKVIDIVITDKGTGIPQEIQDQIFLENFTTKSKGTGLGLSYAKKTVEKWGGSIDLIKSTPGGTTFKLSVPYR